MNATTVYSKTISGTDELTNRTLKLPQALRRVLILVDGTHTLAELMLMAEQVGAPADAFAQLLKMGLIASVENGAKTAAPATQKSPPPAPPIASVQRGLVNDGANAKPQNTPPSAAASSTNAGASNKLNFDLVQAKRQLVKLIEKHLGPGGERIAVTIEDATDKKEFLAAAMKAKAILHNVAASSVNDPFWLSIGI